MRNRPPPALFERLLENPVFGLIYTVVYISAHMIFWGFCIWVLSRILGIQL